MSDISDKIREYVGKELMFEDDPSKLTDDTPLLGGVVDSLGLMQLLSFLETEFDVSVEDSEVTAENFRTIADIERLIQSKVQVG